MRVNYSNYGKRYDKENKPVVFVHICVFPLDQQGAPHPLMCDRQSLGKLKVQLSIGLLTGRRVTYGDVPLRVSWRDSVVIKLSRTV